MGDNYAYLRYEGLSEPDWNEIQEKYNTFGGSGASITMLEGKAADGWLQINAGGPNAFGYTTALKNIIIAQIGPEPVDDEVVPRDNARCRTGDDVREYGNGK